MRFDKEGNPIHEPRCIHNPKSNIICSDLSEDPEKCERCGWNPEVAERRRKKNHGPKNGSNRRP